MSAITKQYQEVVSALIGQAMASFESLSGVSPAVPESGAISYDDLTAIAKFFDRSEAARIYAKSVDSAEGVARDAISAKIQSDLLAGMQRDLMMQRRGRIDATAAEASRRQGHARSDGPINGYLMFEPRRVLQIDSSKT